MRLACVYVPKLALQAILRRDPERREEAVALSQGSGAQSRILALTEAAQRGGIRQGMTVSQARGKMSDRLRIVPQSEADTVAAAAALADLGFGFSPRVEQENERIFFEVGDLLHLYPHGERAVAQAIVAQAARLGLAVRVAITAGKGAARVATQAHDVTVIPPGDEQAFLASLPTTVATDALGAQLTSTLDRWGIRTLGALAKLSSKDVALRLGPAGARLWRVAAGIDDEPLSAQLPPDALEEGSEIEYPIFEIEPLAFIVRGLLDRALARLATRSLACAGITLRLTLDPRGFDVREIPLGAPTQEASTLLALLRLELARRPPAAAVVGVTVLVLPARLRAVQLDFLRPAGPTPERFAATLARLAALVGLDNVGAPAAVDTHREEAIALRPFKTTAASSPDTTKENDGDLSLGFRRFRPPQALEVLIGREGPMALQGRETTARVLVAAGPYRVSGEWWADEGWSRDYWDVQASDGALYRLHQDRQNGQWYLDGYYD